MLPDRKHTRLPTYDYTSPGTYFVTICTHRRRFVLGDVRGAVFVPSRSGWIVDRCWRDIPSTLRHVTLDVFQLMPNHVHGLLVFGENAPCTGARAAATPGSLAAVVRGFKSASTRRLRTRGLLAADEPLWQDGFHEHVVRNDLGLERIREYIRANPAMWHADEDNPDRVGSDEFARWLAEQGKMAVTAERP